MINEILEQRNLCDAVQQEKPEEMASCEEMITQFVQQEKPEEMASCEEMITQFVETYLTPFILRESENFHSTLPVAMKYN